MDDIAARRQHDVGRGAAVLADQFEGAGLVRPVGKNPPHQSAGDDRQVLAVTRRQRQHGLARRSTRSAAATTGGTAATEAAAVKAAAGSGIDAGPEGGARFIAGAAGASGTDAGGTGGGRSLNICAAAGAASPQTSTQQAQAPAAGAAPARIDRCRYPPES